MKKDVNLVNIDLQGETRGATALIIWGTGVVVVKVEVRRNVGGGDLGAESEKEELFVKGMQILGWFKEVKAL